MLTKPRNEKILDTEPSDHVPTAHNMLSDRSFSALSERSGDGKERRRRCWRVLPWLASAVLTLGGCATLEAWNPVSWFSGAEPSRAAQGPQHPFFPLGAGSEWSYEFVDHSGGNGSYSFRLVSRGALAIPEIDQSGFVIDEISPQGTHPTAYFVKDGYLIKVLGLAYGKEGVLTWTGRDNVRQFGWNEVENLQRMLPAELEVGASWKDDSQILNARVRTSNDVVGAETVETPAGRFDDALRIDSTILIEPIMPKGMPQMPASPEGEAGVTYKMTEWYARDFGLIRSVTVTPGESKDEPVAEIVLTSAAPIGRGRRGEPPPKE